MKNQDLYDLFLEELADMYSAEQQLVEALPKVIKAASSPELKEAIANHLKETENQVKRIEQIYSILEAEPEDETCEAMEGLIKEADDLIKNKSKSATLDAGIIAAAQKVEHYEIASYGTLRCFAKHLGFDSEVATLLQDTLDEEGAADKKLTKLAEGGMITSGINQDAVDASRKNKK